MRAILYVCGSDHSYLLCIDIYLSRNHPETGSWTYQLSSLHQFSVPTPSILHKVERVEVKFDLEVLTNPSSSSWRLVGFTASSLTIWYISSTPNKAGEPLATSNLSTINKIDEWWDTWSMTRFARLWYTSDGWRDVILNGDRYQHMMCVFTDRTLLFQLFQFTNFLSWLSKYFKWSQRLQIFLFATLHVQ